MLQTILLVEDNADDEFAFKWAFKKAQIPCALQVVTDGKQAIEYMAGKAGFADRESFPLPHIVFLDLKLPYFSGHEVLEWMREQPSLEGVTVVILSGSDERRDHERAESKGVSHYLVKPAEPADLSRIVESIGLMGDPL
jgi:CheY-like chemotaxis protein